MAEKESRRRLSLELTSEQMRVLAPLVEETGKVTIGGTLRGSELSVSFIACNAPFIACNAPFIACNAPFKIERAE